MITAAVSNLTFDEVKHLYRDGDAIVPSVTQVLDLAGLSDVSQVPLHHLERKAEIGTAVHRAAEYLEEDDLDLDGLDATLIPYVTAYQKFREATGFTSKLKEERGIGMLAGMKFGFCVDRLGEYGDGRQIILDLKTSSSVQKHWAIQTAAYSAGLGIVCDRAAVHLKKDGTYKVIEHTDPEDYEVFACALRVAHWRLRNGTKLKS